MPQLPTTMPHPPLIVITGPTASGKSDLAMNLAERYGGEIICADSRTVYRGMDIGTAKPSLIDQTRIPHHLLDVVDPGQSFSVADFQQLANSAIDDIRARGRVPFLVGGTGLYINSVVFNYTLSESIDEQDLRSRREELENHSVSDLQEMIKKQHLDMPNDPLNKRRLLSRLLRGNTAQTAANELRKNTVVVGIATEAEVLSARISARATKMFASGVVEEASELAEKYGWESEAMTGKIYPIAARVVRGEITEDQAIDLCVIADRQLVKKQLTWFRRQPFIQWLSLTDAKEYIEQHLSSRLTS